MTQAQTKSLRQKLKPLRPYLSLPLILLVTILLWLNLPEEHFSSVYSNTGTWDLQGFNFDAATAALHGRVETIYSPFLTPQEFSERGDESVLAYPRTGSGNATVRINIVLPTNDYYTITRISTGNADRIYVNGEWLRDIGVVSGDDLYSTTFTFATRPIAGAIEIIHQQSNFIYHIHGIYRTGTLEGYNHGIDIHRTELTTSIILGILIALAITSSLMFILLHSYRPALLFSLLCVAWFLCIGAMGSRAFFPLMPWHIDPLRVRLAIIISPVTSILMAAIVYDMFPGVLHKYFVRTVVVAFSAITVLFLIVDIGFILTYALWVSMGLSAIGTGYAILLCLMKLRQPDVFKSIFFAGVIIFGYASLRDLFSYLYLGVGAFPLRIPPFTGANFTRIGVVAFLFCQAAAIFIATMQEMEKSKNEAQENGVKNATSENLAKMRRDYLADMSHEMNHPLTVVSVHIQQAARRYAKSGGDDEVISNSLLLAQKEIMNAAHIAKSSLKLATLQIDKEQKEVLETSAFLSNYLEGYRAIIERTGNKLTLNIPENIPHVFVNVSQLGQVLMNLLTNAYTHTKNGVITVTVESKAQIDGVGFVMVTVEDNGTGIPSEILVQVFERGISSSGGTGLGLPISKDITESHGGVLHIKSEPNKGVAATFTIPIYNGAVAKDGDGDV